MAGRQKKTEQIIENKIEEKEVNKVKVEKQETSKIDDFMTPENMMKMFAMFQQMQQNLTQENKIEDKTQKIDKNKVFTKADLAKITDEVVVVKSAVDNVTFISPKTKIEYSWSVKGDIDRLPVSEILAMESASKRFLHTPWLIIEDERVIQALALNSIYDLIKKVENIDELIQLSEVQIQRIFDELPAQYKNNFRNEIYKKVKTRELNSLTTIDSLSKILKINLRDI